jgi:hypothetical protein
LERKISVRLVGAKRQRQLGEEKIANKK